MIRSTSDEDAHAELREALRCDAARVPHPPFDAALHASVMRQVRATQETARSALVLAPWLLLSGAGATALAVGIFGIWWHLAVPTSHPHGPSKVGTMAAFTPEPLPPALISAWAYQQAAARNDRVLIAKLDRDMCRLLPPSAPLFSSISTFEKTDAP